MALDDQSHLRRDRAEAFGAVAADYDRYRQSYPEQLIDDLAALRPHDTLDVGCGTGKAAVLLAARGLHVLGVEPDPHMAAVARAHGIEVEVAAFEEWRDAGRTFDLITCGQAWHWVDPVAGAAKAARVLRPGGTLALFWNFDELDETSRPAVDAVYARMAPEARSSLAPGSNSPQQRPYLADLQVSGAFAPVTTRTYEWEQAEPVDEWVGRVGTHSDHLLLGRRRVAALQAQLRAALAGQREVRLTAGTYAIFARVT